MTLCMSWITSSGKIIAMSDSRLSGGDKIDCYPKIEIHEEAACFLCWEGAHEFSLPILKDIARVMSYNPLYQVRYRKKNFDLLEAVTARINFIWKHFDNKGESSRLSFIFGAYDFEAKTPILAKISYECGTWEITERFTQKDHRKSFILIGSGVDGFRTKCSDYMLEASRIKSFTRVIDDFQITCTGGIPQIVLLDNRGFEMKGIIKDGKKFFFSTEEDEMAPYPDNINFIRYENLCNGVIE